MCRIRVGIFPQDGSVDLSPGNVAEGLGSMSYYIALIHKDSDSSYGVSFPDVPGVITGGETIDEAMHLAVEVLEFAAEDWPGGFPQPRSIDELRRDPNFQEDAAEAVIAAVPFREKAEAAE